MKKTTLVLIGIIAVINLFAQTPNAFKYQAIVRDPTGNIIDNKLIGLQISILEGSIVGLPIYIEAFAPTTNQFGLININLGNGAVVSGNFDSIDWADGPYFLKVELDTEGGTNYSLIGTSQLLSVPYALHAKTVESYSESDPIFNSSVAKGITQADTTRWNAVSFNGDYNSLTNLPDLGVKLDTASSTVWDKNAADDFDGNYASLTNLPDLGLKLDTTTTSGWDKNIADDFDGDYNSLTNLPDWSDSLNVHTFNGDMQNQNIVNLADPVNSQDAATKAYVDVLIQQLVDLQVQLGVTDIDANHYNAVKIGNQVWMAENLAVTHYRNGASIPLVTDSATWTNLITGAYSDYDDDVNNSLIYGRLYNWFTVVDTQHLCPVGWHVPSDNEWTILETYLGGNTIAGGKMKESGTTHWISPNTDASNESGFFGLPGGYKSYDAKFSDLGYYGNWWSTTVYDLANAWRRKLGYNYADIYKTNNNKKYGFSIRCIKD